MRCCDGPSRARRMAAPRYDGADRMKEEAMAYTVFLVEDNRDLCELLATYLRREGWETRCFSDGAGALAAVPDRPHLWILDIMLPDIDGFYLLKTIREASPGLPVIFISARDRDLDRVLGLEMGSDDYIAKPFLPRELVIRVRRLLERAYGAGGAHAGKVYVVGGYTIDQEKRAVFDGGTEVVLTSREADLVLAFAANAGKPLSREKLLSMIWDDNYFGSDRVVDDLVRRVRKKLPRLVIETVYGEGYRLIV